MGSWRRMASRSSGVDRTVAATTAVGMIARHFVNDGFRRPVAFMGKA